MKKIIFLFVALLLSVAAHAKGGGSGTAVSSFIPIEDAQRVRIFDASRNKLEVDGQIFVCVAGFISTRDGLCAMENDPQATSKWQPMMSLVIPGYEITGFVFQYSGSSGDHRNLHVYFRKR